MPECTCKSCPECHGTGNVFWSFGGRYLGNHRCDDLDRVEKCTECDGGGIIEVCDFCRRMEEEEMDRKPCATWKDIKTAPKDATEVSVRLSDGTIYERAHWASNLSGEEQPPFEGWFVRAGSYFAGIPDPVEWRPIAADITRTIKGGNDA